jgi:hypothetical protein
MSRRVGFRDRQRRLQTVVQVVAHSCRERVKHPVDAVAVDSGQEHSGIAISSFIDRKNEPTPGFTSSVIRRIGVIAESANWEAWLLGPRLQKGIGEIEGFAANKNNQLGSAIMLFRK